MATTIARCGNCQAARLTKTPQEKAKAFLARFGTFQGVWRAEETETGVTVGKEQFD